MVPCKHLDTHRTGRAGVAFLVALQQNRALIGDGGLTPASTFMEVVERRMGE